MIVNATEPGVTERTCGGVWRGHVVEVALVFALIFLYAGTPPPDVNEAHYLAKAKHFWNPAWCGPDVFLDSADVHTVFYAVFGWPTLWVSLPIVTWCGRLATWALVAWGWQRLSWSILPCRYISVLTAAWFLVLNDSCHLAGEWAIGGLEAKGVAYALVLWGLRAIVLGRWATAWIWLGAASALHVLVGGWSMLAAAIAWLLSGSARPALRSMWPGLVIGAGVALTGLLPALWLTSGADEATATEANLIYVFGRLPHHLVFHSFAPTRLMMFGLLIVLWMVLSWSVGRCEPWLRLHRFALGALTIAVLGIMLDLLLLLDPPLAAKLLRFYWYRLADVAVPLVVSMALPVALKRWESELLPAVRWLWSVAVLLPVLLLGGVFVEHQVDFRPEGIVQSSPPGRWNSRQLVARCRSWQDACAWIAQPHGSPGSFPDAAQSADIQVVCTARGSRLLEGHSARSGQHCRVVAATAGDLSADVIEGGLGAWSDEQLREIAERQQVDYIVVDRAYTNAPTGFSTRLSRVAWRRRRGLRCTGCGGGSRLQAAGSRPQTGASDAEAWSLKPGA